MNASIDQLLLNVGFVAQQGIGYSRNFTFDFPKLTIPPDLGLLKFEGTLQVSRTSEGLLCQGEFQGFVSATCGRCLVDTEQFLTTTFAELFTFQSHIQDDTELVYPEDGQIDFAPIVREYLLLEVPINPVCKTDCKGLCPICGNNLNHDVCDHGLEPIDPRMVVLQKLLDDEEL